MYEDHKKLLVILTCTTFISGCNPTDRISELQFYKTTKNTAGELETESVETGVRWKNLSKQWIYSAK